MKNMSIFLFIWFVLYLIGFLFYQKSEKNIDFMTRAHTNICRAMAAIIIILQHVAGGFGLRYFTPLGGIGVAIFLILSGYGLNESFKCKGIGEGYWKLKIIRVLVPYLIIRIAVALCVFLTEIDVSEPKYWYINFILFWYLIYYAVVRIPGLYRNRYGVLGVASAMVFIVGSILNNGLWAEQAVSFLVGVLISDNYEKAKRTITDCRVIIFFLTLGITLLGCKQIPVIRALEDTLVWQGIQLVMKVSVATGLIGLTDQLRVLFNNRMISGIGLISYELYLVHINILTLLGKGISGMIEFLIITLFGAWIIHWMTKGIRKKLVH